jgi:diacylglycerol O-acyltransferase / wax synthase
VPASRLTPLDASFLAVETPTAHMHVGWAAMFEPPEDGPRPGFEELREHIAERLPRAPRCRQRAIPVPFGLNAPVWADDPHFDVSRHVVRASSTSLTEIVDQCISEPLPRDRPLWQFLIAECLDDGRVGMVGKAHHCMVDGVAAVELGSLLLDPEPHASPPPDEDWRPEPLPRRRRLLLDGLADLAREQLSVASVPARLAGSPRRAREIAERAQRAAFALGDALRPAVPVRPFNQPISPMRHLEFFTRPLDDLLAIKSSFDVKLNDVVLAACASGVRRFLRRRGEDPARLKTMVPVSVREPGEQENLGNRISFMFIDLPCDEPDPVRRLRDVHLATSQRKDEGEAEGAQAVLRSLGLVPTQVQGFLSRIVASPRTFNLVVSNIPGPPPGLYLRGCPLVEAYPVVPIADRHALSIGFTTIGDGAHFGLYADRRTLPDVDQLGAEIDASIDELLELSAGEVSLPVVAVPAG